MPNIVPTKKLHKGDKYFPGFVVQQLYETIDNPRDMAYIMYHIETGLRVKDVVQSEWVHVDWQNYRTYTYDQKKGEWRFVYWPEKVKSKLKMWYKEIQNQGIKDRHIFPFTDKTANRILKRWVHTINFPLAEYVASHWCRHTFIRLSRRAGRDIKAVQQNTGDTIQTLLEWYSTPSQDEMREQIEISLT